MTDGASEDATLCVECTMTLGTNDTQDPHKLNLENAKSKKAALKATHKTKETNADGFVCVCVCAQWPLVENKEIMMLKNKLKEMRFGSVTVMRKTFSSTD